MEGLVGSGHRDPPGANGGEPSSDHRVREGATGRIFASGLELFWYHWKDHTLEMCV